MPQKFPIIVVMNPKALQMIESQIKARGVRSKAVLNALLSVPRDTFVPEPLKQKAYEDRPLPIGCEQTISQPYIVAYMTELLNLSGPEKVLEVGTGSGYQTAILSHCADMVYTIELEASLSTKAQNALSSLGLKNIHFKVSDGYEGWKENAPYDGIIVTAAAKKIPDPLIKQLAVGGRMVIPVESKLDHFTQEILLITRTASGIKKETKIPVQFVPMRGKVEK
jgi:protein-L-isoaspartate(D-aspartate) O-methyltransferase